MPYPQIKDSVLEAIPASVIVFNDQKVIQYANEAAAQLFRYNSSKELVGKEFKKLFKREETKNTTIFHLTQNIMKYYKSSEKDILIRNLEVVGVGGDDSNIPALLNIASTIAEPSPDVLETKFCAFFREPPQERKEPEKVKEVPEPPEPPEPKEKEKTQEPTSTPTPTLPITTTPPVKNNDGPEVRVIPIPQSVIISPKPIEDAKSTIEKALEPDSKTILVTDQEGILKGVNKGALDTFVFTDTARLIGKPINNILLNFTRECSLLSNDSQIVMKEETIYLQAMTYKGFTFDVEVTISQIKETLQSTDKLYRVQIKPKKSGNRRRSSDILDGPTDGSDFELTFDDESLNSFPRRRSSKDTFDESVSSKSRSVFKTFNLRKSKNSSAKDKNLKSKETKPKDVKTTNKPLVDVDAEMIQSLKLQNIKDLARNILDSTFDALLVFDESKTIKLINDAMESMFNIAQEETIGNEISSIFCEDHCMLFNSFIRRYLLSDKSSFVGNRVEITIQLKDGIKIPVELQLKVLHSETSYNDENVLFCAFIRDLTTEKEQEAEATKKQHEYELELIRKQQLTSVIIDVSFDALFLTSESGVIDMVNQAAVQLFGWSREELIGENFSKICSSLMASKYNEAIQNFGPSMAKCIIGRNYVINGKKKDASEIPVELGIAEVRPYSSKDRRMFCAFIKDLTSQKETESDMNKREELIIGMINASYDSIFALDRYGKIFMVNDSACERFGWTREEFLGCNIQMLVEDFSDDLQLDLLVGMEVEVHVRDRNDQLISVMLGLSRIGVVPAKSLFRRHSADQALSSRSVSSFISQEQHRVEFVAFIRDLTQEKQLSNITMEKLAADELLHNILPKKIAMRLKNDPSHIADYSSCCTIMFADLVGFTKLSGTMTPRNLVKMLNELFSMFDSLADIYDLNKVKTIGDCYMVSSEPSLNHNIEASSKVCMMAHDMNAAMKKFNLMHGYNLNLRIGINTGPIVAGVVGTKRFLYDMWGDAVNVASRMESTGVPGKIQVTKHVVNHVSHRFAFKKRGKVAVKGKGNMETYFLLGPKKSQNPNEYFRRCSLLEDPH